MNFLTLTLCHCGFVIEEECAMHPTVQSAATFWWFLSVLNHPSLNACTTWLRRNTIFNSYFHKWFLSRHLFPLRRRFARLRDQIWKKTCKIRLGNGLLNAGWSPNKLSPLTPMNDQGRVSPLLDISIIHSWNSCALVWTLFGNPVSTYSYLSIAKKGAMDIRDYC